MVSLFPAPWKHKPERFNIYPKLLLKEILVTIPQETPTIFWSSSKKPLLLKSCSKPSLRKVRIISLVTDKPECFKFTLIKIHWKIYCGSKISPKCFCAEVDYIEIYAEIYVYGLLTGGRFNASTDAFGTRKIRQRKLFMWLERDITCIKTNVKISVH